MWVVPIDHLPHAWRPGAYRLRDWALTDGPVLVIIGLSILAKGMHYFVSESSSHPAETALPMDAWGVIWVCVGALCLVCSPRACSLAAQVALSAGVGLQVLWAGSFFALSMIDGGARGWVTAVGYADLALVVMWAIWRGRRGRATQVRG